LQGRKIGVSFALAKDRFKELEEKGEIEKQEFEAASTKAESDVEMDSDADAAADEDTDIEMESAEDIDADTDGDDDVEAGENSDEESDPVVDESLQEGCTLFVRNLSFDSEEDDLFELFRVFGKLRYVRIVYDQYTGKSRGTAFVCFWTTADAAKCLVAAEKAQSVSEQFGSVPSDKLSDKRTKSVLLQETAGSLESTSQFTLDGRLLSVAKAVDRNKAQELATEGVEKRKAKDKRCAYLLKEGIVFPGTPAASLMAPADLEHHIKEYGIRKNQILKNPNLFISKTRLTIHNIPRSIDEAALRSAAMSAIAKFKNEVKAGKRQPLSADERAEGWDRLPSLRQVKIIRSTDRVDAKTGKSRSLGYGFVEFSTHAHALACLRYLNFCNSYQAFSKSSSGKKKGSDEFEDNDEDDADEKQRPTHEISRRSLRVMFSIENARVLHSRELRTKVIKKRQERKAGETEDDGDKKKKRFVSAKGKNANRNFGMPAFEN
ncbi:RNA recognition motif-containing protein, partial [Coemansia erecta]